jgi:hypothetical protein
MRLAKSLLTTVFVLVLLVSTGAAAPLKYSLSVFHFNIEYVIGGLYGFVPGESDVPTWEIGPDETEDMIVVESFAPVLDLLDRHPNWTLTIELQAYFIEVLAERHTDVLDQLRDLVDGGQVELVSFHYADQIFIGYPYEDWKRSNDRAHAVMAEHDLTLSGAVFCQEGQAAEGMARRMAETGYDVLAWPKNLWKHIHGDTLTAEPYYTFGDVFMVAGGQGVDDPDNEVFTTWNFLDDGELMATGDWDPYFPWFFKYNEEAVAEYEAKLELQEADDYIISGITQYVDDLIVAGIEPADPPPLLDGTWQPPSTNGSSRWFGHKGIWGKDERDNHVRSLGYLAHQEVLAAETAAAVAGLDRDAVLDEAWRLMHRSQVSDGTGINPYKGEIEFCIATAAEAIRIARGVIDEAKQTLGLADVLIDTAAGEVTAGTFTPQGEPTDTPPLAVAVAASDRDIQARWFDLGEDTWRLEVEFSAAGNILARDVYVTFPGTGDQIITTTALIDDEVRSYDRADFDFPWWYLVAPTGLIGLGDDWWVVKDAATVHVAALVSPDNTDIAFEDESAPFFEGGKYVFYVMQGSAEQALALADRVNVHPTLAR